MQGSHATWHFLTNHSHVLLCIVENPDTTVREAAQRVGITERAVMRIIGELDEAGVIERTREGRRNHYAIDPECPLRHPIEAHCTVGDLIEMFRQGIPAARGRSRSAGSASTSRGHPGAALG